MSESVVRLESFNFDGKSLGFGTGFVIGEGLVATVWHVVDEGHKIVATNASGVSFIATELECADVEGDVAVVRFEGLDLPGLNLEKRFDQKVKTGGSVLVVGHPNGHVGTLSQGVVSGIRERKLGMVVLDELQISAAISPGSSGSPIVSLESGEVIGIATRKAVGELINFAASVKTLIAAREASRLYNLPLWADQGLRELVEDPRGKELILEQLKLSNKSDWGGMIQVGKQLIELYPENIEAKRILGVAYLNNRAWIHGLPLVRDVAEALPNLGRSWEELAFALHGLGRRQEAEESAKKVMDLWPYTANSHYHYIAMVALNDDRERASELLKETNAAFDTSETLENILKAYEVQSE